MLCWLLITKISPRGGFAFGSSTLPRVGKDTGDLRPHSRSLQAEAVRRGPLNVGACQAQEPREAFRAVLKSRSAASPAALTRGHHQHSLGQLLDCAYTGYHLSCIADFSSFQTFSSSVRMLLALVPFHRQGN